MDHAYHIAQLARHRGIFERLLTGLSEEEIRWKPAPEKWCLLEVVCHLYDEERDDFRARLQHVITTPHGPLPHTDPEGWVTGRMYVEQDFNTVLERFLAERGSTLLWLNGIPTRAFKQVHVHPKVGPIPAELFLVNWVAHDLLHFRQINALRYGHLAAISPVPLDYAGSW